MQNISLVRVAFHNYLCFLVGRYLFTVLNSGLLFSHGRPSQQPPSLCLTMQVIWTSRLSPSYWNLAAGIHHETEHHPTKHINTCSSDLDTCNQIQQLASKQLQQYDQYQ